MIDKKEEEKQRPPIITRWDSPWTIVKRKTMCGFHNKESDGNFWIPMRDSVSGIERAISICQDCLIRLVVDEYKKRKKKEENKGK